MFPEVMTKFHIWDRDFCLKKFTSGIFSYTS